jgi:alkanesulfonate monooxygenase SsuD/methylene tetrahydromethanopterin reductase-like flavin-dependent oxidoreductase (luciferase family)
MTCAPPEIPRKLEALAQHCAAIGRSPDTITKTWLGSLIVAPTFERAVRVRNDFFAARGMVFDNLPEALRTMIEKAIVLGDPDTVGEFVRRELIDRGLDGIIVNMPANGHEPEAIHLAAETLRKAIG